MADAIRIDDTADVIVHAPEHRDALAAKLRSLSRDDQRYVASVAALTSGRVSFDGTLIHLPQSTARPVVL